MRLDRTINALRPMNQREPYVREEVIADKFSAVMGRLHFAENIHQWIVDGPPTERGSENPARVAPDRFRPWQYLKVEEAIVSLAEIMRGWFDEKGARIRDEVRATPLQEGIRT